MIDTPIALDYTYTAGRGAVALPARHRAGQHPRPALPGVRQGLRAAARRVPELRRAHRGGGRGRRQGHDHDVLHRQHPVRRRSVEPPFVCATSCSTAPTCRSLHLVQECRGRRGPHGHARRGGVGAARGARRRPSRASATSGRPASPTPPSRRTRSTSDARRRRRLLRAVAERAPRDRPQRGRDAHAGRRARRSTRVGHRPQARSASRARAAATTSPARPFAFVIGARRASAPGRRSASRTSRWTARGRSTRRGCGCRTATSTPRSSTPSASRRSATCADVLALQLDPVLPRAALARLGQRSPRCRRARCSTRPAQRARPRRGRGAQPPRRADNPYAQRRGDCDVDELLAEPYLVVAAARRTTARRSPTAPPRSCSPPATSRREVCERPAWIRGIDHRIEPHALGVRDLDHARRRRALAAREGRRRQGRRRRRRAARAVHAPGADPARGARARRRRRRQPVGRRARGQPDDGRRASSASARRRRGSSTATAGRAVAHATSGPCLQQNLVCVLEGATDEPSAAPSSASGRPSTTPKRDDVSIAGLVREAARARARRRRARLAATSTPSSSARRPTCSRA